MDIGCHLPVDCPAATREVLLGFVRRMEALSYDSLWASDHIGAGVGWMKEEIELFGAIAGDAGKGAAVRQNRSNRQAAAASQQTQSQRHAGYANYEKAYAACLSGRGYSVK